MYPPKVHQFAYVTDEACTEDEILSMEIIIMKVHTDAWGRLPGNVEFLYLLQSNVSAFFPKTEPKLLVGIYSLKQAKKKLLKWSSIQKNHPCDWLKWKIQSKLKQDLAIIVMSVIPVVTITQWFPVEFFTDLWWSLLTKSCFPISDSVTFRMFFFFFFSFIIEFLKFGLMFVSVTTR